jgi:hypothetical protein
MVGAMVKQVTVAEMSWVGAEVKQEETNRQATVANIGVMAAAEIAWVGALAKRVVNK